MIINLGTCGGVAKNVSKLDIILAKRTFQYDVVQLFGTPSIHFQKSLKTNFKISWVDLNRISERVQIGTIASADRDLCSKARKILKQ